MVLWRTYFVLGIVALVASFVPWIAGDSFISVSLLIMAVILLGFSGIDKDLEELKTGKSLAPLATKKRRKK